MPRAAVVVVSCVAVTGAAALTSGASLRGSDAARQQVTAAEVSPGPTSQQVKVVTVPSASPTTSQRPTRTSRPTSPPQPTSKSRPSPRQSTATTKAATTKAATTDTSSQPTVKATNRTSAATSTPSVSTAQAATAATLPPRRVHKGDLTITKDGTIVNNWEITGVVRVQAKNVIIRNSLIRGLTSTSSGRALVSNWDGHPGLLIEDTTIREDKRSPYNSSGVQGYNFTLRRVHIVGGVDNVQIYGPNVLIQNSVLENTSYYASHYSQRGGPTHNDGIQILKGDNIRIKYNTIRGSQNFAVLGAPEQGTMRNLVVSGNKVDDGHCTMKFSTKGGYAQSLSVTNNVVGRGAAVKNCGIVMVRGMNLTTSSGNRWSGSTSPVALTWTTS